MKTLKLLLKIAGLLIIAGISISAMIFGYDYYEKEKKLDAELNFPSEYSWEWHDEYYRVQIASVNGRLTLRKVNLDDYEFRIWKDSNEEYAFMVLFDTPCEPDTKIETSKKFKDGDPMILYCDSLGKKLIFRASITYKEGRPPDYLEDHLDGFSYSENVRWWDFTKLDQALTLSKAVKREGED
jgi:hypothetical protein